MEIEIKLMLSALDHRALQTVLPPPHRTIEQTNHYFDDTEFTLAATGWGLRLRRELAPEEKFRLTLKHASEQTSDFARRGEWERDLTAQDFERLRAAPPGLLEEAVLLVGGSLQPPQVRLGLVARLENLRSVHALPGMEDLAVELDTVTWPDGTVTHELELELGSPEEETAAVAALRALLRQADVRWRTGRESKLERLLRMIRGRR